MTLQVGNGDFPAVKYAGGQRGRYLGLRENVDEVLHTSGTAGGDHGHAATVLHRGKLIQVIAVANTIGIHAIQHNFAGTEVLCFGNPGTRIARC